MYYELNWFKRLRAQIQCSQVSTLEPCFATTACLCSNGYFRVVETMPDHPDAMHYDGFVAAFQSYKEELLAIRREGDTI